MKSTLTWMMAVALALLMLLAGILTGCTRKNEATGYSGITVYYLFPGEAAPVEGPQMRAEDFERLLHFAETKPSATKEK